MDDNKLQTWINFAQFFIGTFALGIITLLVNNKIQEREVEIKEQEQIGTLVEKALDENVEARLRLAKFYSAVTRSDAIRARWVIYRKDLEQEFKDIRDKAEQKQKEIEAAQTNNASALKIEELQAERDSLVDEITTKPAMFKPIPTRVYFHIGNESLRSKMQQVSAAISAPSELIVPGIQFRQNSPSANELRYFRSAEKLEAESITKKIRDQGVDLRAVYVPGYETSTKVRPRHFELWVIK